MRILHITNAYPYDEYASYGIFVKEQIHSLSSIGLTNEVIFLNARKYGFKEYFNKIKSIKKIVRNFNPDIIHCHHEFSLIPLLFIFNKKPVLLSLLGDLEKRSRLNKLVFKVLKHKTIRIILKNKIINDSLYRYLPNGVNLNLFKKIEKSKAKEKLNLSQTSKYILFVTASLNNPVKRYDKYEAVIKKINLKLGYDYVPLILSGVERDLVPFYYNSADLMLLTSDHEGSPNAIKEAMACDLPIVSTKVGNVKELFGNSTGNYISNSGLVDDLLDLSIKALTNNKSNGKERLLEIELSMDIVAEKLHSIYKEMRL